MRAYLHQQIAGVTCFFKGGMPKPPTPPPPPVPATAADAAAKNYQAQQRKRALGFSSTILTGGVGPPDVTAGKTLLGQ